MNISAKRQYLSTLRNRYRTALSRKDKAIIIEELVANLHCARKSAIRALHAKPLTRATIRKGRKEQYGYDLVAPLTLLWNVAGNPCSKRLKPQIPSLIDTLKRFGEVRLYGNQENLLKQMGYSSIDRLLAFEKLDAKHHGLSGTKRSPLLKTLIPVRTGFDDVKEPGHVEMDCVLHCGNSIAGTYAQTVNMLDIHTHWNEKKMILKKNYLTVVSSIHTLKSAFPFPLQSIDFDNGYEFVNWHLYEYCQKEGIAFTRSRSYHKNDQAHIEGKNFQSVRKVIGYSRIDTPVMVTLINTLYSTEHRLLTNFFYATLKLKKKIQEGGRVRKLYEAAKTPYQRVLESHTIPQIVKDSLQNQYQHLNPAELQRSMKKKLQTIQSVPSVTLLNQATPSFKK